MNGRHAVVRAPVTSGDISGDGPTSVISGKGEANRPVETSTIETRSSGNGASQMAQDTRTITAIDVGTTKVCTIMGRRSGPRGVTVVAHSVVPCNGLRKGNVYDASVTAAAIRESVEQVERVTGQRVVSAFVGITGSHLSFENRRDRLDSIGTVGVITAEEVDQGLKSLSSSRTEPGRKLVHTIQTEYSVDGEAGIRSPLGMHSRDVEVDSHVVSAGSAYANKLVQAIEKAGVEVEMLVLEPLASGMAVLQREDKERETVVVDIGGGTTDIVGFKKGQICYTGVVPVGGYQFTNDIAVTYKTSFAAAEAMKLKHGNTEIPVSGANDEISIPAEDRVEEITIRRIDICRLIRERAQELIRLVALKLEEAPLDRSNVRVVLTGGASNLPGFRALMQRALGIQVRHGVPNGHWSVPAELKNPAYATSLGILLWAATQPRSTPDTDSQVRDKKGPWVFLSVLIKRFTRLMPMTLLVSRKGRS